MQDILYHECIARNEIKETVCDGGGVKGIEYYTLTRNFVIILNIDHEINIPLKYICNGPVITTW